jgi:hypothetical protein
MKKSIIGLIVFVLVVVAVIGYYEVSSQKGTLVSTNVVTGKITAVLVSGAPAGPGVPGVTLKTSTSSKAGVTLVTISTPSGSFTQILQCGTAPYYDGETVQVADQLFSSGQHQYSPDIACTGGVSPFKVLYPHGYTSTTSSTSSTSTHP